MRNIVAFAVCLGVSPLCHAQTPASGDPSDNLGVAEYTASGELAFPDNVDEWIHLGSAIGHGYSALAFTAADPGTIHVVLMEPSAYRYFLEHKRYADGTMLLLSFYGTQAAPQPELNGFTQANLLAREIHVIDRRRFEDQRGFFLFAPDAQASPMVPAGNECVTCHAEHGQFDSTFTQFYPVIRDLIPPQ
jgi:hypothetical protein